MSWNSVSTLPYSYHSTNDTVVLNNEIHIFENSDKTHYKYNQNNGWTQETDYPGGVYAVVVNGEINTLGGLGSYVNHYKYSNGEWVEVSTLPYTYSSGSVVVLNNEIHILGGDSYPTRHYKYSNGSWISVSTLPYDFLDGCAVILNDEIHILGGGLRRTASSTYKNHYKYSNGEWVSVSTLPEYIYDYGQAIVLNDNIHILNAGSRGSHYMYLKNNWYTCESLPSVFNGYFSTVLLNNKINIIGCGYNHYEYRIQYFPNKILYGDIPIIDLSQDTVIAEDVLNTVTFHDFMGMPQNGAIIPKTPSDTSPPIASVGDSIYATSTGYLSRTIQTPQIVFECSGGGCQTATSYTHNEFSDTQHLDTNYVHYDANGDIVIDKAMPTGYIYANTQQGRNSSGDAVYGSLDIRVNGTSQLTLTGSSSTTAPTGNVSVSLKVGDVISVYSKCSKTGTTRCKFQMNIRTAAPPSA